jgi:hypothetical protein
VIYHAWTTVCQKSIIDRDSNNISLDILEQVSVSMPPIPEGKDVIILPISIEIVSLWYREMNEKGSKGNGRIKIFDPKNNEVGSADIDIDLTNSHRHRTRIRLDGLPILKDIVSQTFHITTEIESNDKWTEVARVPLQAEAKKS